MVSVVLVCLFAITALCYASIGFGGGSTYTVLLALHGTDYLILPTVSLLCNIVVVSGGAWRFIRAKALDVSRIAPLLIFSIPAAWIGGWITVDETLFTGAVGRCLVHREHTSFD